MEVEVKANRIVIIIISVFLFLSVSGIVFSQYQLGQTKNELSNVNNKIVIAQSNLANAQANLATATQVYIDQQEQIETISTKGADTLSQLGDYRTKYNTLVAQVSELEKITTCTDKPNSIDYTGNSTVSNSLKTWLENSQGKINNADWEAVWTNSKASIHKLTGKFLFVYIVYFNEPSMGYKNAVYDVGRKCFLDYQP
jgi:hypothetical protein